MKTTHILAIAACAGIILAPFGAENSNEMSTALPHAILSASNSPTKARSTNATPAEVKPTNAPIALQSPKDLVSKTDTNGLMSLPLVQQFINQAFQQGIAYGTEAAIQNKTLVQMGDYHGLHRAAMFLRFGAVPNE